MAKSRKKLLIVDGYNVLRSGSRYIHMRKNPDYTHDTFNRVREALISDVATFAGSEYDAIIVFDAADNDESAGKSQKISGVRVMFSPYGSSADKVIEKLAYDAKLQRIETLVVTSDSEIQDAVFGGGVDRMSANGFSLEMDELSDEAKLDKTITTTRKSIVAERIDKDTLAKLIALRDRR